MAAETHTINDLAATLGTTPKQLRAFIRRMERGEQGRGEEALPGKGKRYALSARSMERYAAAWRKAHSSNEAPDKSEAKPDNSKAPAEV